MELEVSFSVLVLCRPGCWGWGWAASTMSTWGRRSGRGVAGEPGPPRCWPPSARCTEAAPPQEDPAGEELMSLRRRRERGGRREVLKEEQEVGTVQRRSDKTIISIYKCKQIQLDELLPQIRRNSTNCGHKPENVLYLGIWRHVPIILSNIIIIPYFIPIIVTTFKFDSLIKLFMSQ